MGKLNSKKAVGKKTPKIVKLCHEQGNCQIKKEIILFIKDSPKVQENRIKVEILEINQNTKETTKYICQIVEIFEKSIIVVKMPNFIDTKNSLFLIKGKWITRTGIVETEPVDLIHINENNNTIEDLERSIFFSDISNIDDAINKFRTISRVSQDKPETIIKAIHILNCMYQSTSKYGNSIYHDAILYDKFPLIEDCIRNFKLHKSMQIASNELGETVLHSACYSDKSEYMKLLLEMECSIDSKNRSGSTPLHIAIESKSKKCIDVFIKLLTDENNNYKDQMKKTLCIYNRHGYTPLHMAVLNDLKDLVAVIIKFCNAENAMFICSKETLGDGNRITHLAASRNNRTMLELIVKEIPEAKFFKNYEGLILYEELNENYNHIQKSYQKVSLISKEKIVKRKTGNHKTKLKRSLGR